MTPDNVKDLTAPFEAGEHEFLRGMTYLTESAITRRLDEVDPTWSFRISLVEHRADKVVVYAAMTVCGVTRESNGMEASAYKQGVDRVPENEANYPEKAAVTDALKRCARLFGIGRYILDLPDSVKDMRALTTWLNNRNGSKPAAQAPIIPIDEHNFGHRAPDTRKPKAAAAPKETLKGVRLDAAVWVKVGKDGNPFYVFYDPKGDQDVYAFTRAPFRSQGWDADAWEYVASADKGLGAQINLDRHPMVDMERAADGYWHVTRATAYQLCDEYVEGATA
jgi:hypothetical protein